MGHTDTETETRRKGELEVGERGKRPKAQSSRLRLSVCTSTRAEARTTDGVTPLFMASQEGHLDVVKALLAAGANVNSFWTKKNGTTETCLQAARRNKHQGIIKVLEEAGGK